MSEHGVLGDAPSGAPCRPFSGTWQLLAGPHRLAPEHDITIGPRLLRHVAVAGGQYARWYLPRPTLAFTLRDRLLPGFPAAVAFAQAHGFTPVLRAPGGRAVAYGDGALCLELVAAQSEPRPGIRRRFAELADLLVDALRSLGVPAEAGAIPGEYCPGEHSVGVGGRLKLAGTAQRLVRGGWLLGASLQVTDARPVREVLAAVYDELGLPLDPGTVAAASDVVPGLAVPDVAAAVLDALTARVQVDPGVWPVPLISSDAQRGGHA